MGSQRPVRPVRRSGGRGVVQPWHHLHGADGEAEGQAETASVRGTTFARTRMSIGESALEAGGDGRCSRVTMHTMCKQPSGVRRDGVGVHAPNLVAASAVGHSRRLPRRAPRPRRRCPRRSPAQEPGAVRAGRSARPSTRSTAGSGAAPVDHKQRKAVKELSRRSGGER